MKVYLSLGSNLGCRLTNLERALNLLERGGCRVLKISRIYETAPQYYLKQPAFFNMAAACETSLSPEKLLALIGSVERALKRRRLVKNGPRTLDADILFYGGQVLDRPGLVVPHPRLAEREFVLAPLAELAPALRHPVTGLTVKQMLSKLLETGSARPLPRKYKEAETWLNALPPPAAAAHYSLAPVKAALAALGGPQAKMGTVVHLTGSTGKTSSAYMAAAALAACGWRTGLYTSPHVVKMRERIKLDGRDITEKDFLACFLRVESAAAGELSFFETLTAIAFLYFSLKKTRFAVVEAGLGGGLDATNAADGAVAGITSVSLEHVALLGPGLAEIATHKAGIVKGGAAVVTGFNIPPAALRVIERRTAAVGARLFVPERVFPPAMATVEKKIIRAGRFQLENALFAIKTAALAARLAGLKLDKPKAYAALPAAIPPGRFEVFEIEGRRVVVDGAHNPEGLAALLKEFPDERPVCVAAFMGDKALGPLVGKLYGAASRLILTRSHSYRSAGPADIKKLLPPEVRSMVLVMPDPLEALRRAVKIAKLGGTVLVTGSLYLAGDILAGLKGRKPFHPREMLVK